MVVFGVYEGYSEVDEVRVEVDVFCVFIVGFVEVVEEGFESCESCVVLFLFCVELDDGEGEIDIVGFFL